MRSSCSRTGGNDLGKAIVVDAKEINRLAIELKGFDKEIKGAFRSAINRTFSHVQTVTAREVTKVYNISKEEIKPPNSGKKKNDIVKIKVDLPTTSHLHATIQYVGRTLTMMHFEIDPQIKFPIPDRFTPETPVKVKIKKSGGFKKLNTDPKPFVFKFPTNHKLNVWKRTSKRFYPVMPIRTLSIPQMITNDHISKVIQEAASTMLQKRIEHEVDYRLKKISQDIKR